MIGRSRSRTLCIGLLKGGTKLLKGGTKLLKGGTNFWGWATGGGVVRPPDPPPGYGPVCDMETRQAASVLRLGRCVWGGGGAGGGVTPASSDTYP